MNVSEIKRAVKRQFGDESGAQITDEDIVRWINDAQVDIVRKTELVNEHRESGAVSGDGTYELPSNFMAMARVTFDNRLLPQRLLRDLDLDSNGVDTVATGTPQSYYVWSNTLFLYPAPSASGSGNLDIWYVSRPTTMANDTDIPDLPVHMHEDIVRYCLVRAKELDDDYDGAKRMSEDYDSRIAQVIYESTSQPVDSYPAVRALPGDDY